VPSKDAVTMLEPSELKLALTTRSVCPNSVAIVTPVWASHTLAVLSSDAVTIREPSTLKAASFIGP
jgi:hypothetical protein